MRYRPGALAVVGSNPTGPTEYMGSYTLVKYTPMSEVVKRIINAS
jgi:hypothetical protein